jgi:choline dehydrogenase
VAIKSSDPEADPILTFNYLQHEDDIAAWRRCIRLTREIIGQPAMDAYRGEEIHPGLKVSSDKEIDDWVRANLESAYHPCGTCRMGSSEEAETVVDTQCRVLGVEALRVVDASVFPTLPNGNINAPTIMVAEKVADMILKKPSLPRREAPVWISETWETDQRERAALR